MREKLVRKIVDNIFIIRYWVVLILMAILIWFTYHVYHKPGTQVRDVIAVFAGGSVLITIFYQLINYEYSQRKFKHDIKSSKDTLSFNVALEWHKEFMTSNVNTLYKFYKLNKTFLDDGAPRKFHEELEKEENEKFYDALLSVFNFLETLCLGVKQGIMDEEFIKGFFNSLFIVQYNRYITYIEYRRREKQNPKIWVNFTTLSEKWITCI